MCRFVYYQGAPIRIGQLLTEPEHSLIHQSFHSHERDEPLNGDGFGVAWFAEGDPTPALFRSVSPAWSNLNLSDLARVTRSGRILAHVRAATAGIGVSEANCHPFRVGALTFMHNGSLGGFPSYRRPLLEGLSDRAFASVGGTTDSEHLLALVWDAWMGIGRAMRPEEKLAWALESALGRTLDLWRETPGSEPLYINCTVTDGDAAVACRFTTDTPDNADTLYSHQGRRYTCVDGVSALVQCPDGGASVLISSEPLTPGEVWDPVPVGGMVLVGKGQEVRVRPVSVA